MAQQRWEVERLWEHDTTVVIEQWTQRAIVAKVRLVVVVGGVVTWLSNVVVRDGGDGVDGDADDDGWNS
jgi:hypothetical protein